MELNHQGILALEERFRAQLINSILGYKNVLLIGTKSVNDKENLSIFNSIFHLGADPALCGMVIRPQKHEQENTLGNILETKSYTLNHILPNFVKQAHQCSAKYPPGQSEFEAVGLLPLYKEGVFAPFVQQSSIHIGCEFVQKIDIPLNETCIIIGKIIHLCFPDQCLKKDGFVDIHKAKTVVGSGLDAYYQSEKLQRLSYAKADRPLENLDF